jgi:hypothetical protein
MQIAQAIDAFLADPEQLSVWRRTVTRGRGEFGWAAQAERLKSVFRPLQSLAHVAGHPS